MVNNHSDVDLRRFGLSRTPICCRSGRQRAFRAWNNKRGVVENRKTSPPTNSQKIRFMVLFRDFEGDQGWIHKSLINKISSIITKKEKSNIRSGPGTTFKVLFSVEKGIPFKIIKKKGAWIHIQHADGEKGWIHRSLVW